MDVHGYCRAPNGWFTYSVCCETPEPEPEVECETAPTLGCVFGVGTRATEQLGYLGYAAGGGPSAGDRVGELQTQQIIVAMDASGWEDITTVEQAFESIDYAGFRFNAAYDEATGESYDHLKWYGGGSEVGVFFRAGTTEIVAMIGDGDIYDCTAFVPKSEGGACDDGPTATEAVARRVLTDNGAEGDTRISFSEYEVLYQLPWDEGSRFSLALDAAIKSFLGDDTDVESPLALLVDADDSATCPQEDPAERLRCHMSQPDTLLALVPRRDDADDAVYPPEHRESIDENWVFYLSMPSVSDHLFWAVVPHTNFGAAYNYGFN
ncbi:MAG: hypothetical protein JRH11_03475 [Deltaproteobacteria bacterium]|nr:hypothetical protein [Deltaproteobacteria bacterium]